MFKAIRPLVLAAISAALFVGPLRAATYVVPSDAQMVQTSDDIVVATAIGSEVGRDAQGSIVTRTTLRIDDVLKGERAAGQTLVLTEQGGILPDGKARVIGGTPQYEAAHRYLLFTTANAEAEPATYGMALGQFFLVEEGGEPLAIRSGVDGFDTNYNAHVERPRHAERFERFIREVVAGRYATPDYFVSGGAGRQIAAQQVASNAGYTRGSYLMNGNFRWQGTPNANFVLSSPTGPIPTAAATAVSTAVAEWTSTDSNISYSVGAQDNTAVGGMKNDDNKNSVLFGDPNNEVGGAAAIGGAWGDRMYNLEGESFINIAEVDIVVAAGLATCLGSVMTHEMGHTLGIRHAGEAPSGKSCGTTADCVNNAIMTAVLSPQVCARNGSLLQWDLDAAATVYGSGPVCTPPSITQQPQSKNISAGGSTNLTVIASGSGPLTYQWFIGNAGDTSTPTGTNAATITVGPATTTSYWVRVTNGCGGPPADSSVATVAVICTEPAITTQPANVNINEGQSTQLRVFASGSGLTYQWYAGASGDTSTPIGSPSASNALLVQPTQTSSYWVRVSGTCGSPVNSNTVTVTVAPCAELTVDPPTASELPGVGNFRLNVTAFSSSGPITFAWFRGNTPGFGGTAMGSTQAINVTVTAVSSFWARVTNGCGKSEVSSLVTVAPCSLPSITTQPGDVTINSGAQTTLTVAYTGTATVLWYEGAAADESKLVGGGNTLTVAPTQTTKYWAKVVSTCGPVSTRTATVTVNQAVTSLPMLGSRFTVEVRYRNQFANPATTGLLLGRSLSSSTLSDTAIFWFNDPTVVELMVRLSDARPFDNHIHVFYGGLSDVEFFIKVTDATTGKSVEYNKKPNELVGFIDRVSFTASNNVLMDALTEQARTLPAIPNADSDTVTMLGGRYKVRMRYRNQFANPATTGYLLGRSIASSNMTETVVFFNDPQSVEWMVRFSDARPFDNHIHFFHGGLSDLEFTIEVTDLQTGQTKEYKKLPNNLSGAVDRVTWVP